LKDGDELEVGQDSARARPKISVFSNVDYLIGRFNDARRKAAENDAAAEAASEPQVVSEADDQEEVSFVWEVNGRTEPHKVWIYPDGSTPEKGLCIRVDRFGGAKVLGGDGSEDE
jgi:hypothetical protein